MEQVEFELLPNGECVVKQRGIILFQIEAGTMYLLACLLYTSDAADE